MIQALNKIIIAFGFFSLTAICTQGFAQHEKLGKILQAELQNPTKAGAKYEVLIVLQDNSAAQVIARSPEYQELRHVEKARFVYSQLKRIHAEKQADILSYIQSHGIRAESFWLVNAIVCELTAHHILTLAMRNDVQEIELNSAHHSIPIMPVAIEKSEKRIIGAPEPGLLAIGADFMWRLGYTGRGRIAYSIDTGVWPEHPSIKRNFLANYVALEKAWLGFDSQWPADKANSHGTHTIGTMVGLDASASDSIGMAPNAYFISSDPVATGLSTVRPLSDFIIAFEWAFNPDGDTTTWHDVPDVINNSWGYGVASGDTLCEGILADLFLALELAGIANVFSAGNSGPGPSTIGLPQHITVNELNSFTVGALNANNPNNTIADFSSRGPGVCPASGSTLIRPEVSAPGVQVRSAVDDNAYAYLSGTSMAAPHVSGAVLLLKEAFPMLSGNEILQALYITADDLGEPGEDNTYGSGIINLQNAFEYLSLFHNPVSPNYAYDIAIDEVLNPASSYFCESHISPLLKISNKGIESIAGYTVSLTENGQVLTSLTHTDTLEAGQSYIIELPSILIDTYGKKEWSFRVEPEQNVQDVDVFNNLRRLAVYHLEESQLPYVENFETGIINTEKWALKTTVLGFAWDTVSVTGQGINSTAIGLSCGADYAFGAVADIISAPITLGSGAGYLVLAFDLAYQHRINVLSDTLKVYLSNDCGQSFPHLIYAKGGSLLSTTTGSQVGFIPSDSSHWRTEIVDISAFSGEEKIMLKFSGLNRKGNTIVLDNICLLRSDNLSVESQSEAGSFPYIYPSPVRHNLNVVFPAKDLLASYAEIIDNQGKTLLTMDKNMLEKSIIDVSSLPAGIYYLRFSPSAYPPLRFVKQ